MCIRDSYCCYCYYIYIIITLYFIKYLLNVMNSKTNVVAFESKHCIIGIKQTSNFAIKNTILGCHIRYKSLRLQYESKHPTGDL